MQNFVQTGNFPIPKRHAKGLHRLFNTGVPVPFWYTDQVIAEGTPLKAGATQDLVTPCVKGASDGPVSLGLAAQFTYDDSAWGELRNYHLANHTGQRLDGQPILVLSGAGYALTNNYLGTPAWNENLYVGPSGYLEGTAGGAAAGDKLPVVSEGVDDNVDDYGESPKKYLRIRYNFNLGQ